jgi:hypothetical protein
MDLYEIVAFEDQSPYSRETTTKDNVLEIFIRPVGISNWHFLDLKVYLYINIIWNFLKMKP